MKKGFLFLSVLMLLTVCTAALADTVGLGLHSSIASSASAPEGGNGVAQVDTTVCALTLNDAGVITAICFDVAQTKMTINDKGAILADPAAPILSKKELGDAYGMRAVSSIGKEVNEQMAALEAWCLGKTVSDAVTRANAGDDVDLLAGCTVHVSDFMAALTKAAENAQ